MIFEMKETQKKLQAWTENFVNDLIRVHWMFRGRLPLPHSRAHGVNSAYSLWSFKYTEPSQ